MVARAAQGAGLLVSILRDRQRHAAVRQPPLSDGRIISHRRLISGRKTEFKVLPDLPINVRWVAIEKAMDTIAERVIGLSEGLFPWAKSVKVRKQWLYDWHDETDEIDLPATDKNTPK
jgi:hypothetical protein